MKIIKRIDQMGREVLAPEKPLRIVSLVPSQTELLVDLGLSDRIVGLTKFCIHPEGFKREKTIVGGTKNVNIDKVRALQPDLIIGNKEENFKADIERLEKEFPVWMSDIVTLSDTYEFMRLLGELVDVDTSGMISEIRQNFQKLESLISHSNPKTKVGYVIWNNPVMLAAHGTFINHLLEFLGFENISSVDRYPEVDLTKFKGLDYLFLSSEPYPFKDHHIAEFSALLPGTKIVLVDGEYFSWYGSRLLGAPAYFQQLLKELGLILE
jgi:ABC-type Fe3+-hydroxamate transport system substrate-binding protein